MGKKLKDLDSQLKDPEVLIDQLEKQLEELGRQKLEAKSIIQSIESGNFNYPPELGEDEKEDLADYWQDLVISFESADEEVNPILKLKKRIDFEKKRINEQKRSRLKRDNVSYKKEEVKRPKYLKPFKIKF